MQLALSLIFLSGAKLIFAMAVIAVIIAVATIRRIVIDRFASVFIVVGLIWLALAAGQPFVMHAARGSIAVMVDLSPSTRGATFRDRVALEARIKQLIGNQPFEMIGFSDHNQPIPAGDTLKDLPADRTVFTPPTADEVVLFSDGRFDLPTTGPPTYPVIDPALDHPPDAAIADLGFLGSTVIATVRTSTTLQPIHWIGATPLAGDVQRATPTGNDEITASIAATDDWPENDALSIYPPPPTQMARWWIGASPPAGWQSQSTLPTDAAEYLQASVIALNNISTDSLSTQQQQLLRQYVRDLGGSLLIIGGDHAFAAGHYDGTPLDALSPLASSSPKPAMQWMVLIDGSGSMAGDGSSNSPWQTELAAAGHLLGHLPVNDSVSIGSFAESLSWWSTGKSARDTAATPPANIYPTGPTNLAAVLNQIANSQTGDSTSHLLLMTDADAELPDPNGLIAKFSLKHIRLSVLAIGHGSALPALQMIAEHTGGSVREQLDPKRWVASAAELLRTAMPSRYEHHRVQFVPTADAHFAPPQEISEWNQTWLKSGATLLGQSVESPLIARWQAGLGQVTAIAFPAAGSVTQALADEIVAAPADPRFTVTWTAAASLHINVDAIDRNQFLNGRSIHLQMQDAKLDGTAPADFPILQSAPGRYELTIPAPRSPQLLTVHDGNTILRRFAIAGRYPAEFDAIGNDRANLKTLADRTGGSVVPPGPVQPIDFHWPVRPIDISSELAMLGFVSMAAGLIRQRQRIWSV